MTYGYEQGSIEWLRARAGKVTASKIADLMAKTKTGWGASRENYKAQLIAERLTGEPTEGFTNAAMQWGTTTEPEARNAYSFHQDIDVAEIGFIEHPTIAMSGASPDGLINSVGLVEIKCPNTATHIATLLGGEIPNKYRPQMLWQMACTGRQWNDFCSYDPRLPEDMRIFVKRMERDDQAIAEIEAAVKVFIAEIDQTIAELTNIYRKAA